MAKTKELAEENFPATDRTPRPERPAARATEVVSINQRAVTLR